MIICQQRKDVFSLVQIRKGLCLTQKQLAEKMDCTQQTVSAIEKGDLDVSLSFLERLSSISGYTFLIMAPPSFKSFT